MEHNHLSVLKTIIGGGIVSFHAVFAKSLNSVNAGLFLSQSLFCQENSKFTKVVEISGKRYFSKTCDEWHDETGLSEESQKTARLKLKSCGILHEKLAGVPAKMHYHIDLESLVAVIHGYLQTGKPVAVIHGNKKRSNTRGSNGKFRQQEAAKNGNIYKEESLESLETLESVSANADLLPKKSLEPIDEAFTPVEAPSKKRKNAPGAEKEKKVEASPALDFSRFDNPEAAKEIFARWLKYRKDIKHPYKSEDTIQTSLKNLFNYSAGRAALAEQIIEKSIGNGYQGFFKPEIQKNGNSNIQSESRFNSAETIASAQRVADSMREYWQ